MKASLFPVPSIYISLLYLPIPFSTSNANLSSLYLPLYPSTYLKRSLRHKPASNFLYLSIPSLYPSASF